MTIIICSASEGVRSRWKGAIGSSQESLQDIADFAALRRVLANGKQVVALLHLALPGIGGHAGVAALRRDYPQARLLVFTDRPDEAEGLWLLQAGVYGYCNTYMAPVLLARAVAAVDGGEVWVGWNLMQRLIKGLGHADSSAQGAEQSVLANLTEREREIAQHIAAGASNKVIAANLGITERTVKAHLSTIFRKTDTRDRLQLALLVTSHGGSTDEDEDEGDIPVMRPAKISH